MPNARIFRILSRSNIFICLIFAASFAKANPAAITMKWAMNIFKNSWSGNVEKPSSKYNCITTLLLLFHVFSTNQCWVISMNFLLYFPVSNKLRKVVVKSTKPIAFQFILNLRLENPIKSIDILLFQFKIKLLICHLFLEETVVPRLSGRVQAWRCGY